MELSKLTLSTLEEVILAFMISFGFSTCTVDIQSDITDLQYTVVNIKDGLSRKWIQVTANTLEMLFNEIYTMKHHLNE